MLTLFRNRADKDRIDRLEGENARLRLLVEAKDKRISELEGIAGRAMFERNALRAKVTRMTAGLRQNQPKAPTPVEKAA